MNPRIIYPEQITDAVARLCIKANIALPHDVEIALRESRATESWPAAADALDTLIENFELAENKQMPICQDTGMACVFLEIGQNVFIDGDIAAAIDEGVRRGYREGYLRQSIVGDPLRRENTRDNTPAMLYLEQVAGDKLSVTVAPKGFGSENMSQINMLAPADGRDGVVDFVVSCVAQAGPNACPPVVVGIGLGGNFDKAALLAKKALLRPLGQPNADAYYAALESELLACVNALGVGPQGFGGATTALGVMIEALPTHIAGLPCAVNISCHATRHASEVL